jgi:hypothetical protein
MVLGMAPICHLFWFLLLALLPLPKDPAVALIIRVYYLHQRVN